MPQLPFDQDTAQRLVDAGHLDPATFEMARQSGAFDVQPDPNQAQDMAALTQPSPGQAQQAPMSPLLASNDDSDAIPYDHLIAEQSNEQRPFGTPEGTPPVQNISAPVAKPGISAAEEKSPAPQSVDVSKLGVFNTPQSSQAPEAPFGSDLLKQIEKGNQQQASGIQAEAAAATQKAKTESSVLSNTAQQLTESIKRQKDTSDAADQYAAQGLQSISKDSDDAAKAFQIDPNRLWHNMGTGSKIMAGVSIALGSLGGALTGKGGNVALDIINNAIERDIDAQKVTAQGKQAALSNKINLYNANLQRFHNKTIAEQATSAALLGVANVQVQQAAAQFGGAEAQAKAQQLGGALQTQQAEKMASVRLMLQQQGMLMGAVRGGEINNPLLLPKDFQNRAVQMPSGGYRIGVSEEAAKKTNDFTTKYKEVNDILDRLDRARFAVPGTLEAKQAQQNLAALKPLLNEVNGINRFTDEDNKVVLDPQIADPTSFLQGRNHALLQNLRSIMESKADATYGTNVIGYKTVRKGPAR